MKRAGAHAGGGTKRASVSVKTAAKTEAKTEAKTAAKTEAKTATKTATKTKRAREHAGVKAKARAKTKKAHRHVLGRTVIPRCAPIAAQDAGNCLDPDSLVAVRDAWNLTHPNNTIVATETNDINTALGEKMSDICNKTDQRCWTDTQYNLIPPSNLKSRVERARSMFAPTAPASWKLNNKEWLTDLDISRVMRQYEDAYPDFEFIGPTPIDFDTAKIDGVPVWAECAKFDLSERIQKGKYRIGFSFNTDVSTGGGLHWISLFADFSPGTDGSIAFFDSLGNAPPHQIKRFASRIWVQWDRYNHPGQTRQKHTNMIHPAQTKHAMTTATGVVHQRQNTECGVYSLYFLSNMAAKRITMDELRSQPISDKVIHNYRRVFFNHDGPVSFVMQNTKDKLT